MPFEQTITIVNNSGKIISTGKQLISLFKEARESYQDKKAQIKSDRSIKRAQTFDQSRSVHRRHDEDRSYRRSLDGYSETSSRRTRRSKSVYSKHHADHGPRSRPPLTETNLRTLSEVSSTIPGRAPRAYRSPYVETLPRDMAMSRMDLHQGDGREYLPPTRRHSMVIPRGGPEYELDEGAAEEEDLDRHLAYGTIPPGLEDMVELDPAHQKQAREKKVEFLVGKVEGMLDEAHCLQHSVGAIIKRLQENPEAAAAVALTLAELSSLVTKMSPAILSLLKGGSPAVFALLASPQFLIGTGIAVGVTVVMFGGWKIVKKIKENNAAKAAMMAQGVPMAGPVPFRAPGSGSIDEALILDEELSTIDTWRRGIAPYGQDDGVELELITPEAERASRSQRHRKDSDLRSRASGKTHKTSGSRRTHKSKREERQVPDRKSSRNATESAAGSSNSKRPSKRKEKVEVKALEDGRSKKGDDELDLAIRPKKQGTNMLKALFKDRKDKAKQSEMVLAQPK